MAVAEKVADTEGKDTATGTGGGKGGKDDQPHGLYAEYQKVQPRQVKGMFRSIKDWTLVVLLGIYFIGPWLRWDRGANAPDQAILMDLAGRRFYFFGLEIWPQEIYYLTGLLILGAIGLFFVTALLGRVWCGFTCIQTVFTDLFVKVEHWLEGDRNARIKLDRGPMTVNKLWRKSAKVGIWALIALATGYGWVMYFVDAPSATVEMLQGQAGWGLYGFTLLVGGFTFLLAGWAREQVCIYMCPWPRFQSAMFDEDSLIVTYEKWRGEPRGFAKKDTDFESRGHCVDCTLCVQVCPTGVDIRNGSQLACIGCGLCIDACNGVMDRFGLPRGLITYDSTNRQVARAKGAPIKHRLVRPRTIVYAVLLTAVMGFMVFSLGTRSKLEVNVLHERSPLFVSLTDGSIRNGYTFKILNMRSEPQTYVLTMDGLEGATMNVVGVDGEGLTRVELSVDGDTVGSYRIYVTAPRSALDGKATDLSFNLVNPDTGEEIDYETLFAGPQ